MNPLSVLNNGNYETDEIDGIDVILNNVKNAKNGTESNEKYVSLNCHRWLYRHHY